MIIEMTGVTNSSAFQKLEDESKRTVLKELKVRGASHRQLERLTGVGRGLIQKLDATDLFVLSSDHRNLSTEDTEDTDHRIIGI